MKKPSPKTVFVFQSNSHKIRIASDPTVETITVLTTLSKVQIDLPKAIPGRIR